MPGELVPIAVTLGFFLAVVALARIIAEARTRGRLIQTGLAPEQVQAILAGAGREAELAGVLKWALVAGSVGLALVVLQFLPYGASEPISYGLVLLFASAGLLGYLALARRIA
jgi:hypothetical protein